MNLKQLNQYLCNKGFTRMCLMPKFKTVRYTFYEEPFAVIHADEHNRVYLSIKCNAAQLLSMRHSHPVSVQPSLLMGGINYNQVLINAKDITDEFLIQCINDSYVITTKEYPPPTQSDLCKYEVLYKDVKNEMDLDKLFFDSDFSVDAYLKEREERLKVKAKTLK